MGRHAVPTIPLTESQQEMVQANMGLVIAYVRSRRHLRRHENDYEQVGMLGLIRAVQRFRPEMQCTIATYSYKWIRREINLYMQKNRTIKPPIDMQWKKGKASLWSTIAAQTRARSLDAIRNSDGDYYDPADARSSQAQAMADAAESIGHAMRLLPKAEREVIEAVDMQGREMLSVATERGVYPNSVRYWRDKGIRRLRGILADGHLDA